MNKGRRHVSLILAAGLAIGAAALGGPLDPPGGPVSSTYKTLSEVEPRTAINSTNTPGDASVAFIISQPGSYYLTSDLAAAGKSGIRVTTSNVSIDFCGFHLSGSPGGFDGISQPPDVDLENIEYRNGTVRNFGKTGISHPKVSGLVLQNMRLLSNNPHGVEAGMRTVARDCVFANNTGSGLAAVQATVTSCVAGGNGHAGITVGAGSLVTGCTSRANLHDGFFVGAGSTVNASSACANSDAGFVGSDFATFLACTSSDNGVGFQASRYCTMQACNASRNATLGVTLSEGASVQHCDISWNGTHGVVITDGGAVRECTARFNTGDGIRTSTDCQVVGNTCDGNGQGAGDGAGIHATSSGNRIDRNCASDNDRGIDVDTCSNVIICNFAFGNAGLQNFVVTCPSGSQWFGPVVPPGTPLSTNPYANFGEFAP